MRIAFVYGPFSIGNRPIDFSNLWDDPRGLTGSEISIIEYASAMAERQHHVSLLMCQPGPDTTFDQDVPGKPHHLRVRTGQRSMLDEISDSSWDAVCVWNEPDILRLAHPSAVRLCYQMLNDWSYCQPGFAENVDVFTSPSASHMCVAAPLIPTPNGSAWQVLPLGCDPTAYDPSIPRTPGKVLWVSSPDRGLHLLLEAWPEIRRRVPHATLDCYYNFPPSSYETFEIGTTINGQPAHKDILELARRARYMRYALPRLAHLGVRHLGSASRNQISHAMSEASVLAFPCDTIRYTEGFSVATMEACAAGLIPIISDVDALGSIYGELGPEVVIKSPVSRHMPEFIDAVCDHINGDLAIQQRGRELAARHAWSVLTERLEFILNDVRKSK